MPKLRNVIRTRALSVTSPAFYSLSPSQSFSCCVRSLSETLSSRFKVCGSCSRPTLCQMVSFQQISSLRLLAGQFCDLFLAYGLQLVICSVDRSTWKRLTCSSRATVVLSLTGQCPCSDPGVGLSVYV